MARWLSVWNASQSFHASSGSEPTSAASLRNGAGVIGLELGRVAKLRRAEQRGPVDAGRLAFELRAGPDGRALGEVLALRAGGMGAGDLGLEIDDALRGGGGVGRCPRRRITLRHSPILGAQRGLVGVGVEIIFALGHAEPALHQIGQRLARAWSAPA